MNPVRFLRAGIMASAAAHLLALMLVLFFTEVHRFGSVTAEPITVDIVSPDEAPPDPQKEEPKEEANTKPPDTVGLPSTAEASPPPAPAPSAPAAAPQPPAARPQQQAALASPAAPPPSARSQPQPTAPAYTPPQPDLTVKYGVVLGLPPELPPEPPAKAKPDDFDAQASKKADLDASLIGQFRRHLKTCAKLPPSIAPSDSVMIRLRVFMTTAGKLAAEPVVIEGSGNLKGLDLRQSAIDALQACQPYAMLPVDRYVEWKVLDLTFTPQDFGG